jgi:kumamolisin
MPRRVPWRRLLWLGLGGLLVIGSGMWSVPPAAATASGVSLPGHVLPILGSATRVGDLAPDQTLTLTIALRPGAAEALRRAALQPHSPPVVRPGAVGAEALGRAYGQSAAAITRLADYLRGFGLAVSSPGPSRLSLTARGTADQVQRALGVHLGWYTDPQGRRFRATDTDPRLPADLAPLVEAIIGLDTYPSWHPLHTPPRSAPPPVRRPESLQPQASRTVFPPYVPDDLETAYNFSPLNAAGLDGRGMTIGILGCDVVSPSDLTAFATAVQRPVPAVQTVPVDGGADGSSPEATLDLEWAGAIAPGATLRLYSFPSVAGGCSTIGFYDALVAAVDENASDILSISLGACETALGSALIQAFEDVFAAAALEGQTVLVASGDTGAYGCYPLLTPAVDYPAASAYVTAVGGTTLVVGPDGSYQSESAWGSATACLTPCGSGGGISALIPPPSWQEALLTSGRGVPDVAYDADPTTGFYYFFGSAWWSAGGTSFGAPQWAALIARADQAVDRRLGFLDPLLYGSVARAGGPTPPFHDITTGSNLLYAAAPGWDLATGWGSPNAAVLVQALAAPGAPTPVPSASPVPTATAPAGAGPVRIFLPVIFNGRPGPGG